VTTDGVRARAGDAEHVVVLGASAGGVEALTSFVAGLPEKFSAAVLVVLHLAPGSTSVLPQILARACAIPVYAASDGLAIDTGAVYVAPSDHHMVVEDHLLTLTRGPKENGHRPAIDMTMRSAATAYGPAATGIVLSGTRDDGTAGVVAIKAEGGRVVVQDPSDALFDSMPRSALEHVHPDAVLAATAMGGWLQETLQAANDGEEGRAMPVPDPEPPPAFERAAGTRFTCPDCGGVLFEERDDSLVRFRCSVGHAYSPDSLLNEQATALEGALWMTIRSLEDRATLLQRISNRARSVGNDLTAQRFADEAGATREKARTIRVALEFPEADSSESAA